MMSKVNVLRNVQNSSECIKSVHDKKGMLAAVGFEPTPQ